MNCISAAQIKGVQVSGNLNPCGLFTKRMRLSDELCTLFEEAQLTTSTLLCRCKASRASASQIVVLQATSQKGELCPCARGVDGRCQQQVMEATLCGWGRQGGSGRQGRHYIMCKLEPLLIIDALATIIKINGGIRTSQQTTPCSTAVGPSAVGQNQSQCAGVTYRMKAEVERHMMRAELAIIKGHR